MTARQFELPETALRSSAVGTNVIALPLAVGQAVQ